MLISTKNAIDLIILSNEQKIVGHKIKFQIDNKIFKSAQQYYVDENIIEIVNLLIENIILVGKINFVKLIFENTNTELIIGIKAENLNFYIINDPNSIESFYQIDKLQKNIEIVNILLREKKKEFRLLPDKHDSNYIRIFAKFENIKNIIEDNCQKNLEQRKILIVDDEVINTYLIEEFIKDLCFKVVKAYNGKCAYEIATNENFDLILMDYMMPVMDGIEAAKEIKKIKPDLPIMLVTAYVLDLKNVEIPDNVKKIISKPIKQPELVSCIKEVLKN